LEATIAVGTDEKKAQVLVIDDDVATRQMLSNILGGEGYGVILAENGQVGLTLARNAKPDVILLDYVMPDFGGVETCAAIKADPATAYIPVIIMTGQYDQDARISSLDAGAVEFLLKPIDFIELKLRIRNILSFRQLIAISEENLRLTEMTRNLDAARQEWEDTFDSLSDIITVHDADYTILKANRTARELLGVRIPGDPAHLKCYQYYHGMKTPHPDCPVNKSISTGQPALVELFDSLIDRHVEVRVSPRHDKEGVVTGYIHVVRDITERKRTQDELEKAYHDLKEAHSQLVQQEKMASIGQLAAGVAHEINNPTGFIMSNLGTLKKYMDKLIEFIRIQESVIADLPEEVGVAVASKKNRLKVDIITGDICNLISESLEGAARIVKIVQDLKSFSRVDQAEQKRVDINAGIESTLNIVWNELKYKATLNKKYGDIPPVKCNPGQLNQVFMNILVNAAHAIEKQGVIGIKTHEKEGFINVSISDTGCGIPRERLKRIFEPFYTTKEVGKGTGLGLSIAYDIVKKHRGVIDVESEVGKGTTFTVRIPIEPLTEKGDAS
jgi:two-component system NtrC family sensor kinase